MTQRPLSPSRKPSLALACSILMIAMVMGGCQQWSTYPPVEYEMTARLQRPAAEPVPTVIARSVEYAQDQLGVEKGLPLNLPQGVPASVYEKVFAHLGGGEPMQAPDQKAIHIKEVRTRGFNAQVDMIYPRPDGLHQLATLTLDHNILERWRVKTVRKWALRDVKPPPPHYVPPPPPEVKGQSREDNSESK